MKTQDKLDIINKYIERLNLRLKERSFKVKFENKGANNYCLTMLGQSYKFNTYTDIINCLTFIDDMFESAISEIEKKRGAKK